MYFSLYVVYLTICHFKYLHIIAIDCNDIDYNMKGKVLVMLDVSIFFSRKNIQLLTKYGLRRRAINTVGPLNIATSHHYYRAITCTRVTCISHGPQPLQGCALTLSCRTRRVWMVLLFTACLVPKTRAAVSSTVARESNLRLTKKKKKAIVGVFSPPAVRL